MSTTDVESRTWAIGELIFSLTGAGPVYEYLVEEFQALPTAENVSRCHLKIKLVDVLPTPPTGATITKSYIGWENGYQFHSGHLRYQVAETVKGLEVLLDCSTCVRRPYVVEKTLQFFDWNYLSAAQMLAKNFMYSCFNLLTGILQVKLGFGCYLHASSIEKAGTSVAFVASGGIGKTTSMIRLVSRHGWRYLSDDIALIDRNGDLVRTPLRMQVYGYNVSHDADLTRLLLRSRSCIDRLSWELRIRRKGPYRTRRRVSPEELFGPTSVSSSAPCKTLIFMERAVVDDVVLARMDRQDFIEKIECVMPREIGGLNELSEGLSLVRCRLAGFSRTEYLQANRTVLEKVLSRSSTSIISLRIPQHYPPEALTQFLRKLLDGEKTPIAWSA